MVRQAAAPTHKTAPNAAAAEAAEDADEAAAATTDSDSEHSAQEEVEGKEAAPPAAETVSHQQQQEPQLIPAPATPPPVKPPTPQKLLSSAAALDFYLFCCCQVAYPSSLSVLFPETEDAAPLVRSAPALDAVRAVFRFLGEPEAAGAFIARRLEGASAAPSRSGSPAAGGSRASRVPPLQKPAGYRPASRQQSSPSGGAPTVLPRPVTPALSVGAGSQRSSSASHSTQHAASPYYSAWALLDLLMAEWLERAEANAAALAGLFRAGCSSVDGRASQQQVAAMVRLAVPNAQVGVGCECCCGFVVRCLVGL